MAASDIAAAVQRVESVLRRRPEVALHDDAPATSRWQGGLQVVTRHASGTQLTTDMPTELGGSGAEVTPGWLLRGAALASCAVTRIVMAAASEGITLASIEARALSRSDARGLLNLPDEHGAPVSAGPGDVQLQVRLSAPGVPAARLRALVQSCSDCSPVGSALQQATPVTLHIEVDGD